MVIAAGAALRVRPRRHRMRAPRAAACVPQSVYVLPEKRDWLPGPFARAGAIVHCSSGSSARFPTRSSRTCSRRHGSAEWRTRARSSTPTTRSPRSTMRRRAHRARDGPPVVRRRGHGARVGAPLAVRGIRDLLRRALDAAVSRRQRIPREMAAIRAKILADTGRGATPGDRHGQTELPRTPQREQLPEGRRTCCSCCTASSATAPSSAGCGRTTPAYRERRRR